MPIAQYLADDPAVDRVIVAGRDLVKARAASAALGPKGGARQVDADYEASLPSWRRGPC
jgi:saccharopine dehydrogenase-like NADP-dependent oxidoreductase